MALSEYEITNKLSISVNKLSIPAEEAYKTLRTNIRFCGVVNKIKTITITSCAPDEGKTTTSINLAISMANAGLKTLLVDTDLRLPAIERTLGFNNKIGITNYITREIDLEDVIYKTNIENFYIIPCGAVPPNPTELLSTEKFSEFIEIVSSQYLRVVKGQLDMIIFDAPPLGSVIDAAILSAQTDGVLLVIRPKTVNYKLASQVKDQLEKANAHILGVVLNKITKKDLAYGYKYYYNKDLTGKKTSRFRNFKRKRRNDRADTFV
jgi:protein-tyrosine kinase